MQYDPSFVSFRPILSDEDKSYLHSLSEAYPLARFRTETRNYDEMVVDFVYTSAKIEGNTYDRIDTANLLRHGITAGGKRYSDAIMLVNLREGFSHVMGISPQDELDREYVCNLHKILMKDLLRPEEQGIVRQIHVDITTTDYTPPDDPLRLNTELKFLLPEAKKYQDPFEQAIYLHCNLAYLQYFTDGNKRTSRLMQTAALIRGNKLPLFFSDTLIDKYVRSTLTYYETGNYKPYIEFFKENYCLAITHLLGHEPNKDVEAEAEEYRKRLADLPKLEQAGGTAYIFWQLANKAIKEAGGDPEAIAWWEVE